MHTARVPEKLKTGSCPISTQKGQRSHQHFRPHETMQLFKLGQGLSRFRGNFQGSQAIAAISPGDRGVLSRAKYVQIFPYSHSSLGGHSQTVPRIHEKDFMGFAAPFQLVS